MKEPERFARRLRKRGVPALEDFQRDAARKKARDPRAPSLARERRREREAAERKPVDPAQVHATLDRIGPLRDELAALDTELARRIPQIERTLEGLGVGVALWTECGDWGRLSFEKHNGSWRLWRAYGDERQLLGDCPRDVRAGMLAFTLQLLGQVAPALSEQINIRRFICLVVDDALKKASPITF